MQPEPYARPFWLNQNYATITVSFVSGYVEGLGETKLTVSLGASHEVLIVSARSSRVDALGNATRARASFYSKRRI